MHQPQTVFQRLLVAALLLLGAALAINGAMRLIDQVWLPVMVCGVVVISTWTAMRLWLKRRSRW